LHPGNAREFFAHTHRRRIRVRQNPTERNEDPNHKTTKAAEQPRATSHARAEDGQPKRQTPTRGGRQRDTQRPPRNKQQRAATTRSREKPQHQLRHLTRKHDKPPETRNLSDGCYRLAPRCRPPIRCWVSRERDPPPRFWKTFLKSRLKRSRETPPKTNKLDHAGSTPRWKKKQCMHQSSTRSARRGCATSGKNRAATQHGHHAPVDLKEPTKTGKVLQRSRESAAAEHERNQKPKRTSLCKPT
jgi:hypothetical protein